MTDQNKFPVAGLVPDPSMLAACKWEEDTVRLVLDKLQLRRVKDRIYDRQDELTGYRRLTLDALLLVQPDLPFHFTAYYATQQRLNKEFRLAGCFAGKLTEQRLIKRYLEYRDERPDEFARMPFAMVVKWPFVPGGVAIHDRGIRNDNGFLLRFRCRGSEIIIEPFAELLNAISARWSPARN